MNMLILALTVATWVLFLPFLLAVFLGLVVVRRRLLPRLAIEWFKLIYIAVLATAWFFGFCFFFPAAFLFQYFGWADVEAAWGHTFAMNAYAAFSFPAIFILIVFYKLTWRHLELPGEMEKTSKRKATAA